MGDEGNKDLCLLSETWPRTTGAPHPAEGSGASWAGLGAPAMGPAGGHGGGGAHALSPLAWAAALRLSRFYLRRNTQVPHPGSVPTAVQVSTSPMHAPPPVGTHPSCVHTRTPRETLNVTATSGEKQKHKCNTKVQLLQSASPPWGTHLSAPLWAPGAAGPPGPLLAPAGPSTPRREEQSSGCQCSRISHGTEREGKHSESTALGEHRA